MQNEATFDSSLLEILPGVMALVDCDGKTLHATPDFTKLFTRRTGRGTGRALADAVAAVVAQKKVQRIGLNSHELGLPGVQTWEILMKPRIVQNRVADIIQIWTSTGAALTAQRDLASLRRSTHRLQIENLQLKDERDLARLDSNIVGKRLNHAEHQISMSQKYFRLMGESLPFGVWRCQPNGRFNYASRSFLKFMGVRLENLNMNVILERSKDHDQIGSLKRVWNSSVINRETWETELSLRGADGKILEILSWACPIFNDAGDLISFTGINLDITSRKQTETALRDSQVFFKQLSENLLDQGLWMGSIPDGALIYLNAGLSQIWGIDASKIADQPFCLLESVHPEDLARVQASMRKQLAGESTTEEYRITRPDGTQRWVIDRTFPVRNAEGRIYRVAGVVDDITEAKTAELNLKDAISEAKQANEVKTQFLANMSHEIRTPLGAILGFAEMLRKDQSAHDRAHTVDVITRNGHQLLGIIDQILDISQVESNRIETESLPASPLRLVTDVIDLLMVKATQKGLKLSLEPPTFLPPRF